MFHKFLVRNEMLWKMQCFALQSMGRTNHKFSIHATRNVQMQLKSTVSGWLEGSSLSSDTAWVHSIHRYLHVSFTHKMHVYTVYCILYLLAAVSLI